MPHRLSLNLACDALVPAAVRAATMASAVVTDGSSPCTNQAANRRRANGSAKLRGLGV